MGRSSSPLKSVGAWGLAALLSFPCLAQERERILHSVRFRTAPRSKVEIWVGIEHYPGDQAVPLDFSLLDPVQVLVKRDGFEDLPVDVTGQQAAAGVFPPPDQAPLALHAKNPLFGGLIWGQEHPYQSLGAAALLGLALPAVLYRGLTARRQHRQLQERLQQYDASRDRGDSMLMTKLDGYLLVGALGRGGMATVYRGVPAESMDESQAVAVKVLALDLFADVSFRRRFQREVAAYQKLSHPNIVRVISWRELDNSGEAPYIVLELVGGETLSRRIPPQGMSWHQARPLLEQVFAAVSYAHGQGVVHRDLKPDNIMVDGNKVKVMDFGLARNHDASNLTATGTILGTPAYMAPEQLSQGSSEPPVDQYALGVVTYRVLSGQLPHDADDVMQLLTKVLSAEPVALRTHRRDLSPVLEGVVMRMLAREPAARYESVAAAWEALLKAGGRPS